uniref:GDSL esterase/lipase 1-like n=1 Tax=Fagus sylvatica TaxID=28930 RepID=A0A2N9FUW4_FAGSY
MKRKSTVADWREVRRWTGVWPLTRGSDWVFFGPSQFFMVVWPSAVSAFADRRCAAAHPGFNVAPPLQVIDLNTQEIYKKGGRKFAIPNLVPLGCLPFARALNPDTGACFQEITALAKLHNEALSKVLQKLESQLHGFKYSIADSYSSLSESINNPSKYGFNESKIACCGTGPYRGIFSCGGKRSVKEYELCENVSEYVFFDSIHPTEKVNQQFAELMWSGTPNITGPYNLKALFEN